ncbi:hypothetical protein V2G26_000454 [Clonostachys chloroleuca]
MGASKIAVVPGGASIARAGVGSAVARDGCAGRCDLVTELAWIRAWDCVAAAERRGVGICTDVRHTCLRCRACSRRVTVVGISADIRDTNLALKTELVGIAVAVRIHAHIQRAASLARDGAWSVGITGSSHLAGVRGASLASRAWRIIIAVGVGYAEVGHTVLARGSAWSGIIAISRDLLASS